ncbi:hypothetical protein ASC77_02975 [Nocardioides sp. Root1257]|uniref:hypothetical protein n=1 Tax=unclassified Nocardioides TaxID=2615069 RepID=UPI00070043D6|nr:MULTISPECIES: hypothetical protein [unclassified Nocardioides]KQW53269.1 hypothetical protein ASC77_02975 [Nocardioides sp. Root1257]KRC55955.1 hypothetical protein ASE24_02975 [Nocardioides sp. Root224]
MSTTTVESSDRVASRGRSRETWVLGAALAMIVVQLGYRAWAIYGGYLHIDDFNFISRMETEGLSPLVALDSYFGHVMPSAMYLSWFNQSVAPWSWALPATELLVLQAASSLGLLHLLRTMFGLRPGILPPLVVFLSSAISIEGTIWWAAAINLLPLQVALFFGLASHITYLRTRRFRHAVAANAWILAGITFNEKTALVYAVLGIVTLCYFAEGQAPSERIRTALRGRVRGFGMYGATGAAYVVLYWLVGREFTGGETLGYPTLLVIRRMVMEAFIPGIMGGPIHWWHVPAQPGSIAWPGDAVVYASLALLLILIWEIRKHRTRTLRALWLPAFFLAVDVLLTLFTRVRVAGDLLSLDYRYQGELAAVSAIALACMTMPILGATEPSERRSASEFLDHPRRVAVACAVMAGLGAWSVFGYTDHWQSDTQAERWFDRLVPELHAAPSPIPLVDRPVPDFVTNGLRYPENLMSHVMAQESAMAFTSVATDTLLIVDDSAAIVPVALPPTRKAVDGPRAGCGYLVQQAPIRIRLDGPVAYGGWWVRIGYLANQESRVRVTTGDVVHDTTVKPGVHALYVEGADAFDEVEIGGLAPGASLCTNDVTVGRPEPSRLPDATDRTTP